MQQTRPAVGCSEPLTHQVAGISAAHHTQDNRHSDERDEQTFSQYCLASIEAVCLNFCSFTGMMFCRAVCRTMAALCLSSETLGCVVFRKMWNYNVFQET